MDRAFFINTLKKISRISPEAATGLSALIEPVNLDRNEYLVRAGQRVKHCYLQEEGVIRVFYTTEGTDYNKTFFVPGMFPTALTALLSDAPSLLSFQALTPARLVRFSYSSFRSMFSEHRCLETLLLRIMEGLWIKKEQHDIRMVTNDATANYLIFRKEYPGLENLIPQYHIASYLGITPIQLSRIRAQLANGG